jgi:hypothetical protein
VALGTNLESCKNLEDCENTFLKIKLALNESSLSESFTPTPLDHKFLNKVLDSIKDGFNVDCDDETGSVTIFGTSSKLASWGTKEIKY